MLKIFRIHCILVSLMLSVASCNRSKSGADSKNSQSSTVANGAKDTIKANLAANDKNTQLLEDGTVLVVSNSIVENLIGSRQHSTFLTLLEKSSLYKTLSQKGPFTVFVPSNDAFEKLDKKKLDKLMTPAGKPELEKILKFHIIVGLLRTRDLTAGESISTVEGDSLVVIIENGKTKLMDGNGNMVEIITPDILNKNGIIHLTNGVLIPKGAKLD